MFIQLIAPNCKRMYLYFLMELSVVMFIADFSDPHVRCHCYCTTIHTSDMPTSVTYAFISSNASLSIHQSQ